MVPDTTLRLISTVEASGTVAVTFDAAQVPSPAEQEVVVRMEAAPINPSDLGTMFAGADTSTVRTGEGAYGPLLRADMSPGALHAASARVGQAIPLGNEGAGVVVAVGASDEAQALLGKTVALRAGSYTQYRCVEAEFCLVLPEGTAPADAASCFVNPLTALGMVETMKAEGHAGLVHTAAASNLGQMLQKICNSGGIPLVNIVRTTGQAKLLRDIGAEHVCNSTDQDFESQLAGALVATKATLGFDATGGGRLASQILAAMEVALSQGAGYTRYGSTVHKQVYLYGSLQLGPTEINRTYGMAWGVGGWLLTNFLRNIGREAGQALMARVASELKTTFASHYTKVVSMRQALSPEEVAVYVKRATGEKYLITPHTA